MTQCKGDDLAFPIPKQCEEGELKRALCAAREKISRLEEEVKRLNQLVKDEKYRTAKAREAASLLEIDVKNAYRQIKQLKGGE